MESEGKSRPVKVVEVNEDEITFDDGSSLYSHHDGDCCEQHWLSFDDLSLSDFDGMLFDLQAPFFEKVEGFGIRLLPVSGGHPVSVPGYGDNNGYYSSNLSLILRKGDGDKEVFDISECQEVRG